MKDAHTATHIRMFFRCGMQYYWRYVMGKIIPPSMDNLVGSSAKTVCEKNLERRLKTGQLMEVEEVKDLTRDEFTREVEKGFWKPPSKVPEIDEVYDAIVQRESTTTAVKLAEWHAEFTAPRIIPVSVARGYRIEMRGYPFDLQGIIHCRELDKLRILKMSKAPHICDIVETDPGITMDHLATTQLEGTPNKVIVNVPGTQAIEVARGPESYQGLLRRLEVMQTAIDRGCFMPCEPSSFYCQSYSCGYWMDVCPYGRRSRTRPKD